MKLTVISGRSGSGKSTALDVHEDAGYHCIDNLPAGLLHGLIEQISAQDSHEHQRVAICIDARNISLQLQSVPTLLQQSGVFTSVIYLDADDQTLIKRFSETRRKHPLSDKHTALQEALVREREILKPIADSCDIHIDTASMSHHELREHVQQTIVDSNDENMTLSFLSRKTLPCI